MYFCYSKEDSHSLTDSISRHLYHPASSPQPHNHPLRRFYSFPSLLPFGNHFLAILIDDNKFAKCIYVSFGDYFSFFVEIRKNPIRGNYWLLTYSLIEFLVEQFIDLWLVLVLAILVVCYCLDLRWCSIQQLGCAALFIICNLVLFVLAVVQFIF